MEAVQHRALQDVRPVIRQPKLLCQVPAPRALRIALAELARQQARPIDRPAVAVADAQQQQPHAGNHDHRRNRRRQNLHHGKCRHFALPLHDAPFVRASVECPFSAIVLAPSLRPANYNDPHHGNSRRRHHWRRHRRREHRLASDRSRMPQRADRRARDAPGQRLHRQEHGRSARPVRHRAQHPDVDVLHPVLCRVRRAARPARRISSAGISVRRHRARRTSNTCAPIRRCSTRSASSRRTWSPATTSSRACRSFAPTTFSAAASAPPTASSIPTA